MARLHHVGKARKDQGRCRVCDALVQKGDAYYHWSFRFGGRHVVHEGCRGKLRRSATIASDKLGRLYDAQDDAENDIDNAITGQDVAQALETCREQAEEVRDEYQESVDNLPEQFQDTHPAAESRDSVESWVDELDRAARDIESEAQESEDNTESDAYQDALDGWKQTAHNAVGNLDL